MNSKEIKAIIFDVGGVLQLPKHSEKTKHDIGIHQTLAKRFKRDIDSWFDAIDTPYGKSMDGTISKEETILELTKNLNISQSKLIKTLNKTYKKFYKKNKKLYKIAHKLKKQEYKIGIISDQWHLSKDILMPKKDIKQFNPIIVSCDPKVKLRKPDIKIYNLLIKRVKLKPNQILFIDNRQYNLKPAKKLGIKTLLFKDNKQTIKELNKLIK